MEKTKFYEARKCLFFPTQLSALQKCDRQTYPQFNALNFTLCREFQWEQLADNTNILFAGHAWAKGGESMGVEAWGVHGRFIISPLSGWPAPCLSIRLAGSCCFPF